MSAVEERKVAEGIAVYVHKFIRDTTHISDGPSGDGRSGILEIIKLYKSLGNKANKNDGDLQDKELRKLLKIAKVPKELLGKKGKVSKLPKILIIAWRSIIMMAGQKQMGAAPSSGALTSKLFLRWVKSPPVAAAAQKASKPRNPRTKDEAAH